MREVYTCDFCKREFSSGKRRKGIKLCVDCAELARAIRKWAKKTALVKKSQESTR